MKLRVRADRPADVVRIDQAGRRIDRHARLLDPAAHRQRVERAEDRVVIDVRADRVAACRSRIDQPLDREVQRIGAVEREDEVLRPLAVEQPVQPPAAFVDQIARSRSPRRTPPRPALAPSSRRVADHRVQHRLRLGKAGGGVVEIQPAQRHVRIIGGIGCSTNRYEKSPNKG